MSHFLTVYLISKKFNLNNDILHIIIQIYKNLSVDIIINKWYNFLKRKSILPTEYMLLLSQGPLYVDGKNIEYLNYIEKNLSTRVIIDKDWWARKILNVCYNLSTSYITIRESITGEEWNNYMEFKRILFKLNNKLFDSNLAAIYNIENYDFLLEHYTIASALSIGNLVDIDLNE
tara:strand:+ start:51 stop:575 length:525 start_codon:yes stop_codon:yes gene_type:complete